MVELTTGTKGTHAHDGSSPMYAQIGWTCFFVERVSGGFVLRTDYDERAETLGAIGQKVYLPIIRLSPVGVGEIQ